MQQKYSLFNKTCMEHDFVREVTSLWKLSLKEGLNKQKHLRQLKWPLGALVSMDESQCYHTFQWPTLSMISTGYYPQKLMGTIKQLDYRIFLYSFCSFHWGVIHFIMDHHCLFPTPMPLMAPKNCCLGCYHLPPVVGFGLSNFNGAQCNTKIWSTPL